MADTDVIIRHGHLLSGLIDKAHCGSTLASVVHCYYELYGKRCAADLVSAFSKLFTLFLQYYRGFTLGIEGKILFAFIKQRNWFFFSRCSFTSTWCIISTSSYK